MVTSMATIISLCRRIGEICCSNCKLVDTADGLLLNGIKAVVDSVNYLACRGCEG